MDGLSSPLLGFPGAQTTFVGRDSEITALLSLLLDPHQRLISVLGPGGVGKTRLALATAEIAANAFPDGVAFVALAGLSDPRQVAGEIATTLEVRGQADRPLLQSVIAALAGSRLLLVLDNLEHLMGLELQTLISQVVQECPGVKILATSREPLQLELEQRMAVSPMQVPPAGERGSEAAHADSVRLFISRALAVAPDFAPGPEELLTVVEICRRVEGLPLAIELAAAWIRVISPAALLGQLDEQLAILAGGSADKPARLRTMRDAIAWSYDRLPPAEATLLRKLSVFRGGIPLAGAEHVDHDSASSAQPTLHLVASLCDKHLLYRDEAIGEVQRFGMLETVREFAQERLTEAGDLASAQADHARYFCKMAEDTEPELLGARENHWFALYTAEASNLREAILWGLHHDVEVALRLLSATWGQWSWRGVSEGLRLIMVGLDVPAQVTPLVRARALRTATAFAHLTGDYQCGATLAAEGLEYIDRIDDRWLQGELLWNSACSALFAGNLSQAAAEFDLALARMDAPRSASERAIRAYVRSHRGLVHCFTGNYKHGDECYVLSVEELRQIGSVAFTIIVLSDASGWLLHQGRTSEAQPLLTEALQVSTHAHTSWLTVMPLSGLALIDAMHEQPQRAARRVGAVSAMAARADLIIPPNFQATLDQAEKLASDALGRDAYVAERNTGRHNPLPVLSEALIGISDQAANADNDAPASGFHITKREREVLGQIVTGRTDRDISVALFISERTVSKHVSTILQKLDAVSRADAAVKAVRLGLV